MDIKESDPPANPIVMPAIHNDPRAKSGKDRPKGVGGNKDSDSKANNWKYVAPKSGESETKTHTKPNGSKEKHMRCVHKQCKCWMISHTTSEHGKCKGRVNTHKPPKVEDMKLQASLKTFLANPTESKLTKKDRKKLQVLLTTIHQNDDSDAASVDLD
jgi:hypothetical protein